MVTDPSEREYDGVERGVALVRTVIARLRADEELDAPEAVPPDALERLAFPNGKPLPPSLREFLKYDARWLDLFDDPEHPVFEPVGVADLADDEFDIDGLGDSVDAELGDVLTGDCYLLPSDADARYFLYVGEPDAMGEYPVFYIDTDGTPTVGIHAPGLDVYLAECFDVIAPPATYGEYPEFARLTDAMNDHVTRNFAGRKRVELSAVERIDDDDSEGGETGYGDDDYDDDSDEDADADAEDEADSDAE